MPDTWIQRLKNRFSGDGDAPQDTGVAASRATGGVEEPQHPDQHSTTGTTPDDTYVGRVSGTDVGYAGPTGAEVRAEAERTSEIPGGPENG
jgi:hypothetical protein